MPSFVLQLPPCFGKHSQAVLEISKRTNWYWSVAKKLDHNWLFSVFGVFRAPDPTQLSHRNSENVQNSTTDKKAE